VTAKADDNHSTDIAKTIRENCCHWHFITPRPSAMAMQLTGRLLRSATKATTLFESSPSQLLRPANARLSSSSSTSAMAYKAAHGGRSNTIARAEPVSAWSAPAAVSSILYENPVPDRAPPKKHVLNCLVQDEPGVLSRVSGILAARGFNIDSLVVCSTEVDGLSRMTIVLQGQDGVVEQARRQLEDLVPVWAVLDYTQAPLVQRELLLAKVNLLGPEYFAEVQAHHREMSGEANEPPEEHQKDFHPLQIPTSQALRQKMDHLEMVTHLTHQFGGKVLDISTNTCIVEVSAKPSRIDSFLKLVDPFGVLESSRSGMCTSCILFWFVR